MSHAMTIDDKHRGPQTIALDVALDASSCGHKASTLAELRNAGHNVPDGFVIPVGGPCSPEALREALERLGPGPYAVRSSGVAEDLVEASFAGQYETVLGVDTLADVVTAARRVRESGKSERVASHRAEIDGDEAPLGVLVQRLINADAAGVMFTANPVTGDNEIVIEAVSGLGDKLMDGNVDGERWVVGKSGIQAGGGAEVLDEAAAAQLVELARQVTRERGAPQDIEWAIADGEIHLLQSAPHHRAAGPPADRVSAWALDEGYEPFRWADHAGGRDHPAASLRGGVRTHFRRGSVYRSRRFCSGLSEERSTPRTSTAAADTILRRHHRGGCSRSRFDWYPQCAAG